MRYFMACLVMISWLLTACSNSLYNMRMGIISFHAEDYRSAFVRLKPEAYRGQRDAQYAVGYMYYYGKGVVENRAKACLWIRRAAAHGQPEAQAALALIDK